MKPLHFARQFLATDAELDETRAELEAMCLALAPLDLAGTPVYIVWNHELAPDCRQRHCSGLWGLNLDLVAIAAIGERWRGRGVAIMADIPGAWHAGFSALCAGTEALPRDDAAAPWFVDQLVAITIHELAHELQQSTLGARDITSHAPFAENAAEALRAWLRDQATGEKPDDGRGAALPADGHGPRFLRAAIHLVHRARAAGITVNLAHVVNATFYGLSPIEDYAAALADEPQRMADRSFAEIRAMIPPGAFDELWKSDVNAWGLRCEPRETIPTVAAMAPPQWRQQRILRNFPWTRLLAPL